MSLSKLVQCNMENTQKISPDPGVLARIELEDKIIKRYESLKYCDVTDRLSLIMDLEYSGVNLQKLFESDDKTLLHDVAGIMVHMNRKDKKLDGFVPRVGLSS